MRCSRNPKSEVRPSATARQRGEQNSESEQGPRQHHVSNFGLRISAASDFCNTKFKFVSEKVKGMRSARAKWPPSLPLSQSLWRAGQPSPPAPEKVRGPGREGEEPAFSVSINSF